VPTHFRRPRDFARALHFLGAQYGPMMQRRADDVGIDQVMAEIAAALGIAAGRPF
jgi:hypothetical protein